MMKSLPLAYNKDMQEDKEAAFDALDTVTACLDMFTRMFTTLTFNTAKMRAGAGRGFTNATDVADYLTKKGVPFRTAHEITGALVLGCIKTQRAIDELTLDELKTYSPVFEKDVFEAISLDTCVNGRRVKGGPAADAVAAHIAYAETWLKTR
ncbi:Argininosuccinate lyase [bioreactor metagenome]|uniref:Argininosuccinate lyase n=1 Tax=bioreactor metagenome TaxID=1076179 RepID=A0A645HJB6_9ZZZZ